VCSLQGFSAEETTLVFVEKQRECLSILDQIEVDILAKDTFFLNLEKSIYRVIEEKYPVDVSKVEAQKEQIHNLFSKNVKKNLVLLFAKLKKNLIQADSTNLDLEDLTYLNLLLQDILESLTLTEGMRADAGLTKMPVQEIVERLLEDERTENRFNESNSVDSHVVVIERIESVVQQSVEANGSQRRMRHKRFLTHPFPSFEKEMSILMSIACIGIFLSIAGIVVMIVRIPECLSCPPGSTHKYNPLDEYCLMEGSYPLGESPPKVKGKIDSVCSKRYIYAGAFLIAAPFLLPLAIILLQFAATIAENGFYQVAALCNSFPIWNDNLRHHIRGGARGRQEVGSELGAFSVPSSLQEESKKLRSIIKKFPALTLILTNGKWINIELARVLMDIY
jgi:hypothetical protein